MMIPGNLLFWMSVFCFGHETAINGIEFGHLIRMHRQIIRAYGIDLSYKAMHVRR
jgi:hypothetical protein